MLDQLPEEVLVNILTMLGTLEEALPIIPCVCRSWSRALRPDHPRVWRLLAQSQDITLGGCRRRYNHSRDFRKQFYRRYHQVHESRQNEVDEMIHEFGRRLRKSDCVSYIRKKLDSTKRITFTAKMIVNRAVPTLFHRTVLHLACWWGRRKSVQMLLTVFQASLSITDDLNATPLLIAAWAGQTGVVKDILIHLRQELQFDPHKLRDYLEQRGAPPLTSSCGGKGPKTALVWAYRKGFKNVTHLILPMLPDVHDLESYIVEQGEKIM